MGKDYRNWPRKTFEDKFAILASMMLQSLERHSDRALQRGGALYRPGLEAAATPRLEHERQRWMELHDAYERAYDGVFTALQFVRSAHELLRRLKDDQEGRDCRIAPRAGRTPWPTPSASILRRASGLRAS